MSPETDSPGDGKHRQAFLDSTNKANKAALALISITVLLPGTNEESIAITACHLTLVLRNNH